ncbi:Major facilitator superfamily (MFS) profile [Nakaseomyces glabratus]|nr:Major facilitator superfamily (MFS) profile [Nakaseomyces glabratus]KAH7598232.1 Major facilitator superfamily (MFS) profile [Nakaseomyces glabratus]
MEGIGRINYQIQVANPKTHKRRISQNKEIMSRNEKDEIEVDTREKKVPVHITEGGNMAFHNYLNDFAHIEDPLERRRLALQKIDERPFGWDQVRTILIAGVGFLTDSYDIFAINLSISMMSYVFWQGNMPNSTQTLLKVSTSVGTVIGQLGFGTMADIVGRKKIYGLELIVMIATTILQTTIGRSPGINFPAVLTFYRIVMGIGIGGDYPLSSIITSEFATTKWRGAIMGAVFANQAWGQIAGGLVALIVIRAYKGDLIYANSGAECDYACQKACDQMWRILIGFGAVPGIIGLYFRLTIPESPRYALDVKEEVDLPSNIEKVRATADDEHLEDLERSSTVVEDGIVVPPPKKASWKDFRSHFGKWKYGKILLGTAGSWFVLDVAFYGLSLNTAIILQTIGYAGSKNVYHKLDDSAVGNLILICAGSLPGYWATVFTVDTIGRKPIQMMGFIILTALFCVIGFAYHKISDHGLLALYVICQFFQNFGPNVTTFIVPGEVFPTRYRSTAHGISAACGKVGAIIAQTALGTLIDHNCARDGKPKNCWLPHVMEIFALFMLLGIFLTLLIPETKRMTLEEISEKYHDEVDISKLAPVTVADSTSSSSVSHMV